ncbi:hypothetical protein EG328_000721 [Venturia inaequalis]|uniref:Arylsulfatase n=1 Tax=Venturia inaequalis TaxID=5025 RepID=A0A8H3U357_VENIN|nr:hypothetical protein EG328_000721 [Venturia inaequalis]
MLAGQLLNYLSFWKPVGDNNVQSPLANPPAGPVSTTRPNIVFILTDDQDLHLNSLDYMPLTQKHLIDQGTFYKRHYCTIAICCPSRVSLWTGKTAHNTNVTDVSPPYGGYPKFISQGLNDNYLPIWLQGAGYDTYYTGKLFNAHSIDTYDKPFPRGWTGSDFLIDPFTYQYLNASFQRNQDPPVNYAGQYNTDILAEKAYGFLDDAASVGNPFFLTIAPIAPHSDVSFTGNGAFENSGYSFRPPIPAKRHEHLFKDVKVPRTANFNPKRASGVSWIQELPRQFDENVASNDHFYRNRLRALQAVDELVDGVFSRLKDHGLLENTYVIYSTDNGYHIGQHRLQPGKECSFEEDINIPLIIRGPGIEKNTTTDVVTTHTDLAATILKLIGENPRYDFDGTAIPITPTEISAASEDWHEHVNVEYWGFALGEGEFGSGNSLHWNNTYKALRVIGKGYNLHYAVWCNGEHELYNLERDPGQLHNLLDEHDRDLVSILDSNIVLGLPVAKVAARLDSLLLVLKSCKGERCVNPWGALHPDNDVQSLKQALSPRYDSFYEQEQVRVKYNRCENGYIVEAEGPQFETDGILFREGIRWNEWV